MASRDAVREALKFLSGANPAAFVRDSTPPAYEEILSDVTDQALREASRREWGHFPGAHELRRAAIDLQTYEQPKGADLDPLMVERFDLQERAYRGDFVPSEWEELAGRFDQAHRPHGGDHLRELAQRIQALVPA